MPGSAFPTLTTFAFGEKPLASSKLNELINALNALKTWTSGGDILYGYDADQLERLAKPSSPGVLWMSAAGIPSWLTGGANNVLRYDAAGQPVAGDWFAFDYHYDITGHTYATNAWRDMPNSSKNVTVAATSTIVCVGLIAEYGIGTYGWAQFKFNIDGTDIDWGVGQQRYNIGEITSVPIIGYATGVPAGTRVVKVREVCDGGPSYAVIRIGYMVVVIPE